MTVSFKEFSRKFPKALKKALEEIESKKSMDDLGKVLVEQIQLRTKLGKGVDKPEGKSKRFKPLKDSTKKARRNAARKGKLSGDTSPAKSNLTFSGDMIDSINHKAKKKSVKLKVDEVYAKFVAEDRPFMNLSKTQVKETIEKLQDDLVKLITKLLK